MQFLRSVVLCVLILTSSIGWVLAKDDKAPLTLAVYQWRPKEELLAKWQPLAAYLSVALNGREVRVSVYDETELDAALDAGQVDFLLTNPRNYIAHRTQRALTGVLATLIELDGDRPISDLGGAIVVRADDFLVKELSDLNRPLNFPPAPPATEL